MKKPDISEVLPVEDRQRIVRIVEQRGVNAAAEVLGSSRHVVERAVGGLPCRRGSIALLVMGLRELEAK